MIAVWDNSCCVNTASLAPLNLQTGDCPLRRWEDMGQISSPGLIEATPACHHWVTWRSYTIEGLQIQTSRDPMYCEPGCG